MPTLLLVEDDPLMREGETLFLQRAGFEVLPAGSLLETSHWLLRTRPTLVLLDIGMPDGDGTVISRWLRMAGIPFVFVTARSSEADVQLGLDLGADDFIVKPIGLNDLVARVRQVFDRILVTDRI